MGTTLHNLGKPYNHTKAVLSSPVNVGFFDQDCPSVAPPHESRGRGGNPCHAPDGCFWVCQMQMVTVCLDLIHLRCPIVTIQNRLFRERIHVWSIWDSRGHDIDDIETFLVAGFTFLLTGAVIQRLPSGHKPWYLWKSRCNPHTNTQTSCDWQGWVGRIAQGWNSPSDLATKPGPGSRFWSPADQDGSVDLVCTNVVSFLEECNDNNWAILNENSFGGLLRQSCDGHSKYSLLGNLPKLRAVITIC